MLSDVPALAGLLETWTATAIWEAGIKVLGWPASWSPSVEDAVSIRKYLLGENHEQ